MAAKEKRGVLRKLAGIFCGSAEFRTFLSARWSDEGPFKTAQEAADLVRKVCEVESRKEFDTDSAAAGRFHNRIRIPYVNWQIGRR